MKKKETVVILGASDKPDRYSYKAFKLLQEHGHQTVLVHPKLKEVEGQICYADLNQVIGKNIKPDTLTLYVNPEISSAMMDQIVKLKPGRVIFNPGTENADLMDALSQNQIAYEEACTLVLLKTGQF